MTFRGYLFERLPLVMAAVGATAAAISLASASDVPAPFLVALAAVFMTVVAAATWTSFRRQQRFFRRLDHLIGLLDQKAFITDLVGRPHFASGAAVWDALHVISTSTLGELDQYRKAEEAYQSYVEAWIHEIKTPLTTLTLIAANNPALATPLTTEIDRVSAFAEQALFYARSSAVEHDYRLRSIRLSDVVERVLRQSAAPLVAAGCQVVRHGLEAAVFSDPKWLDFIVTQVVINAAKYRSDRPFVLDIAADSGVLSTTLTVTDNGLGVPNADIPRVGTRGFVGDNGRRHPGSTGMGLFLCSQLCRKMNIGFDFHSQEDVGTTVTFTFVHDPGTTVPVAGVHPAK